MAEGRLLLHLEVAGGRWRRAVPGQFLHLRVEDSCDPFLRRPLSLHDVVAARQRGSTLLKVVYEVVGRGTGLLAEKPAGSSVDILGPLGNGFDLKALASARRVVIVAGGMGVAPLYFLAKKLIEVRSRPFDRAQDDFSVTARGTLRSKSEARKILVLMGAKTRGHLIGEKMFRSLGCEVKAATDDGSKGYKGLVTELLEAELRSLKLEAGSSKTIDRTSTLKRRTSDASLVKVCACGPKPMLAAVARIAAETGIRARVSLEEFMGCGLGACLGCVIKTKAGYKRICHDGPVFDAQEMVWE